MTIRPVLLLLALLLAAAPATAVQGANPRAQTLATTGNVLELAVADDRGSIAVGTEDPGQTPTPGGPPDPENPLGDPNVSTWFLWDRQGRLVQSGTGDHPDCQERLDGCSSDSTHVAMSEDGRRLVVANALPAPAAPIPLVDDGNRSIVHFVTETQDIVFSKTFNAPIIDLAVDADADTIAIAFRVGAVGADPTGVVSVFRWTGGGAATFTEVFSKAVDSPVSDIALSADGKRVAIASDRYIRYDVVSSPEPKVNTGVSGDATAVAIATGIKYYTVAGYSTGKVVLFSETATLVPEVNRAPTDQRITAVDMRRDTLGNGIGYAAGDAAGQVHLFRIDPQATPIASLVSTTDIGNAPALDVRFTKDGRYLVARSDANVTFAQVLDTGLKVLWTHKFAGPADALAVDGKGELVAAAVDGTVTLFDASHSLKVDGVSNLQLAPQTARNITATYKNDGNRPERVTLQADYPEGWAVLVSPQNFSLDPGASKEVSIRVVSGANAPPDDYRISIEHLLAGAKSGFTNFTVEVPLVRRLLLLEDGPRSLGVAPGGAVSFRFSLRNDGNSNETARLQATISKGTWIASLPRSEVAVGPGEEVPIVLEVQAPGGAEEGDSARAILSLADDATQSITVTATVGARFQPFLLLPPGVEVPAGGQVRFNLTLRNDGNAPDSFDVGVDGLLPAGWVIAFENGQDAFLLRDIEPDETVETAVTLRLPATANLGETRQLRIVATSTGDTSVSASRNLLVTVASPTEPPGDTGGNGSPGLAPVGLLAAVAVAFALRRRA